MTREELIAKRAENRAPIDSVKRKKSDMFRLSTDEIAQLKTIQLARNLPTLRAPLTRAIKTECHAVITEGVGMMSRPPARNGKLPGHGL